MRIVIEAPISPSRLRLDGEPLHNVHVPCRSARSRSTWSAATPTTRRWDVSVRAVVEDGSVDLRGPAVHGKKGERFLYLTWGNVRPDGSFVMFRRAKLMVGDIPPGCWPTRQTTAR